MTTPTILLLLTAITNGCFLLSIYLKKKEQSNKDEETI